MLKPSTVINTMDVSQTALQYGYGKMKQQVKHMLKSQLDQSFGQVTCNIKYLEQLKSHLDQVYYAQSRHSAHNVSWQWK